jgi:hypothetical protein
MRIAPEPVLRAGNETVSLACAFVRNETLRDDAATPMIYAVMDAIHEIPRMLTDWRSDRLKEVRNHFGCFTASRWPGAPDLIAFFEGRLRDYEYDENAA